MKIIALNSYSYGLVHFLLSGKVHFSWSCDEPLSHIERWPGRLNTELGSKIWWCAISFYFNGRIWLGFYLPCCSTVRGLVRFTMPTVQTLIFLVPCNTPSLPCQNKAEHYGIIVDHHLTTNEMNIFQQIYLQLESVSHQKIITPSPEFWILFNSKSSP